MKNQPFIAPVFGLMLGIFIVDFFFDSKLSIALKWSLIGIILCCGLGFWFRHKILAVFFIFIAIGFFYSSQFNSFSGLTLTQLDKELFIQLKIKEIYKPSAKFRKYKAEILQIDSTSTSNFALLYWKKENQEIYPGDEIWLKTKILPTQKPLNPHQFDYAKWLRRQNIHYTIFSDTIFHQTNATSSYFHFAKYKRRIYQKLVDSGYSKSSADLIGAMLLGDRTEMNPQTEENYRKAGVVHILSISGLHVMMVFSIFMILLYPLIYLRNGKTIRILLSLTLIWSFVVFVGFQPPVLRSAVMISVYYITITFRRKPNVYHTLAVSAMILLLINPNFLFDIGFQLSFSAVFFIVYLHPIYQKIFRPKSKFSQYFVSFLGTSISAQLGTFPIAAYYFHQTSGLFLAGNLVMILASYGMIWGGMFALLLVEFGIKFNFFIHLFNGFIAFCNEYIAWLSSFDAFVFENISFNSFEVFLILVGIILIKIIWKKPNFKWIITGLSVILIFQVQRMIRSYQFEKKKEIIVFHQTRNSVVGVRDGFQLDVYVQNISDSVNLRKYLVNPYVINEGIRKVKLRDLEKSHHSNYYKSNHSIYFEGKQLVLTHGEFVHKTIHADYVLIQNNSEINLDSISSKTEIIIDGSNYPNHLKDVEIPFWKTREKGARIIGFD